MLRVESELRPGRHNKSRKRILAITTVCAVAIVLSGLQTPANAQRKPFKVNGEGFSDFIPLPGGSTNHSFVGVGTDLGKYHGEGTEQTIAFTGPTTASFSSKHPFVFTGANGDKLACHYGRTDFGAKEIGEVELFPQPDGKFIAVFEAELNPVFELCTGKFENVIGGSFTLIAITEPFVLGDTETPVFLSWGGEGYLDWAIPERNWKASATGITFPDPENPGVDLDFFAGYSSQLGKFTGEGSHVLNFLTGEVQGEATWTAANGDELNVVWEGFVFPSGDPEFPFTGIADFTVVGGTGRFANATGTGSMLGGFTGIPGDTFFDFEGTLHSGGN